jgi:hypothetical protein
MRAAFGKVNSLHNHVLPWTDRPLVTNDLVAGEDGIDDAGISVARLIPNPWLFLEATGQVFRGDSGSPEHPLYHSSQRIDLSYVGHLRAYQDITEDSNIDLGASFSRGHNASGVVDGTDVGRFTTRLFGVDATCTVASAPAFDLSLLHRTDRMDLEPAAAATRSSGGRWVCMRPATTSSRGAGSWGPA